MPVLKPIGYHLGVCTGNGTAGSFVISLKRALAELGWNHVKLNCRPNIPFWNIGAFCFI